jgi:hypothetical protein
MTGMAWEVAVGLANSIEAGTSARGMKFDPYQPPKALPADDIPAAAVLWSRS